MKKAFSLLLCLVLCISLASAAMAANVQISTQSLSVNGLTVDCEKYNIDGSNYFKLRDLAYLLNGTESQFSVGWDETNGVMSIVTGEAYTPVGGELVVGADKSASAKPSVQTLTVNGAVRSDLSVYNIGGNNYFKLRDLGAAVGFDVDYDSASGTMLVFSAGVLDAGCWVNTGYSIQMEADGGMEPNMLRRQIALADNGAPLSMDQEDAWGGKLHLSFGYDGKGNLNRIETTGEGVTRVETMELDERGNVLCDEVVLTYAYDDGTEEIRSRKTYTYDEKDRVLTSATEGTYDDGTVTAYTYDELGNLLSETRQDSFGTSSYVYAYDANGNCILTQFSDDDGYGYEISQTFDRNGNPLSRDSAYSTGSRTHQEMTYDECGNLLTQYYQSEDSWDRMTKTYDSAGRVLTSRYEQNGQNGTEEVMQYNERGDMTQRQVTYSDGYRLTNTYEYAYDELGNILRCTELQGGEAVSVTEYTYDSYGNLTKRQTVTSYGYGADKWTQRTIETQTWRFLAAPEYYDNFVKMTPYLDVEYGW